MTSSSRSLPLQDRIAHAVSTVAAAVWLGGLLSLGAIAAPLVFSGVPSPTNADVMTQVFARFDKVALACALLLVAAEGARFHANRAELRGARLAAWVRLIAALLAGILAAVTALVFTPAIAELHANGAVRGAGAGGLELDRLHDLAEGCAKGSLGALLLVLILSAVGPRVRLRGDA